MAALNPLSPLNDFIRIVYLEDIDPTTGAKIPVTTGTISALIATSKAPDAPPADNTLQTTATHIGVASPTADQYPLGSWLVVIDAAVQTVALLRSLFGSGAGPTPPDPYFIVQKAGAVRAWEKLKYVEARPATVA